MPKRRDFTINGLFYDPLEQRVIDFVGGTEDLRRRVIRAIGDPRRAIRGGQTSNAAGQSGSRRPSDLPSTRQPCKQSAKWRADFSSKPGADCGRIGALPDRCPSSASHRTFGKFGTCRGDSSGACSRRGSSPRGLAGGSPGPGKAVRSFLTSKLDRAFLWFNPARAGRPDCPTSPILEPTSGTHPLADEESGMAWERAAVKVVGSSALW